MTFVLVHVVQLAQKAEPFFFLLPKRQAVKMAFFAYWQDGGYLHYTSYCKVWQSCCRVYESVQFCIQSPLKLQKFSPNFETTKRSPKFKLPGSHRQILERNEGIWYILQRSPTNTTKKDVKSLICRIILTGIQHFGVHVSMDTQKHQMMLLLIIFSCFNNAFTSTIHYTELYITRKRGTLNKHLSKWEKLINIM